MSILVLSICCFLLLVYPYFIYPIIITVIATLARSNQKANSEYKQLPPMVSVLLSVYNEELVIEKKVRNVLESNYPESRLELIIVSDGSTDRTETLIQSMACRRVKLIRQGREGKTSALNKAVDNCHADILLFTDANTFFQPNAITELVAPFTDASIGLTTGKVIPHGDETGEGGFGKFETFLKQKESSLGIIAGADGAIYAMRRSLYQSLMPQIINDFFHPISVNLAGFRSCIVQNALAYEESTDDLSREIPRQCRMVNQAFEILRKYLFVLITQHKYRLCWVLLSHKLLRWLHLPLFIFYAVFSIMLAINYNAVIAVIPVALYGIIFLFGFLSAKANTRLPRIIDFIYRFQLIHYGYLLGLIDNLGGKNAVVWDPRGGA